MNAPEAALPGWQPGAPRPMKLSKPLGSIPIRPSPVPRALPMLHPNEDTPEGRSNRAPESDMNADPCAFDALFFQDELRSRLAAAVAAREPGYAPRTRYVTSDGRPVYTNRLILESSPYLLQHAHNPVNWFPWGDEAFEAARDLGRPVFLSVGYSTCHWCHVMEAESFEDEEVARILNEQYVPIKVDREERPDVDSIYMTAVQVISGQGGWPMSVWLTPDRRPFFAGTYFPARDGDRGAHFGFLTLLQELLSEYERDPKQVAEQALQIAEAVRQLMRTELPHAVDAGVVLERAHKIAARQFDRTWGGVRGAPKFPSSFPLRLLLRQHARTREAGEPHMALHTLRQMAQGGIHDHVGGGFHRYSVDRSWRVPHFEKMLYDNALLTVAYLEGYQVSGDEALARVAGRILDYVARDMTAPDGGFYSATDADSATPSGAQEEGYYFTWTPAELDQALGPEQGRLAAEVFGVTAEGCFEGRNVLHTPVALDAVATRLGLEGDELEARVGAIRLELLRAREQRPPPLRDDKIQTSWNGLMISAFARGGLVLGRPRYVQRASRAAELFLTARQPPGRLVHGLTHGRTTVPAYAEDYAFLAAGLLDLFEVSGEMRWLNEAIALMQVLERDYSDPEHGGYFLTAADHEPLLAREKPRHDGATPSCNSVALLTQLRLAALTEDADWSRRAEQTLQAFGSDLHDRPHAMSETLLGVDFWLRPTRQVAIVVPDDPVSAEVAAKPLLDVLGRTFLPHSVLVLSPESEVDERARLIPWLGARATRDGRATAYVCEQGRCQLPTTDPAELARQLGANQGGMAG